MHKIVIINSRTIEDEEKMAKKVVEVTEVSQVASWRLKPKVQRLGMSPFESAKLILSFRGV